MFEQTFKNIDDKLCGDACCSSRKENHLAWLITLILLALSTYACTSSQPTATEVPTQYQITNVIESQGPEGLNIEFLAKNTGGLPWTEAFGGATFFNEVGEKIGDCGDEDLILSSILPGEYTYFSVHCKDIEDFETYSMSVSAIIQDPRSEEPYACIDGTTYARDLVIVESGRELLASGVTNFSGVAINANKLDAIWSYGYLALLDDDRNLLWTDICSPLVQKPLQWKEQIPFECSLRNPIPENTSFLWMIDASYKCDPAQTQTP